jgi:hypothetical protein
MQFRSRNAGDNGAIYGGCPDQLYVFTQIRDVIAVAVFQFHDIDHFPISILAGVEGLTFETAVGLLLDARPNTDAALLEGVRFFPVYGSLSSKLGVQSKATMPLMSAAPIAPMGCSKTYRWLGECRAPKSKGAQWRVKRYCC